MAELISSDDFAKLELRNVKGSRSLHAARSDGRGARGRRPAWSRGTGLDRVLAAAWSRGLLLPRQESFASLHILTRRASEGSEALPSLARRVRMSFFGARVIAGRQH